MGTGHWLRLALAPDVGPAIARRLLERFGAPASIFAASPSDLMEIEGLGPKRARSLLDRRVEDLAAEQELRAEKIGARILTPEDADFPPGLAAMPQPPLALFVLGELRPADRLALAIVGPRKPSEYARLMVRRLVPPLCARGIAIVSGLAHGVDAEAHEAALECSGRTVAVVAQGLDTPIYPSVNQRLARRIAEHGAILSVFPFGVKPEPGLFPARNQIVAALTLGTLVVEASETSGALITAREALDLGRPVMACPGDATRANARGSNLLLADGAHLVQQSDDVLGALASDLRLARAELGEPVSGAEGDDAVTAESARWEPEDPLEILLKDMLEADLRPVDHLIDACAEAGFDQSRVVQSLLMLELNGRVRQLPGRVYTLAG